MIPQVGMESLRPIPEYLSPHPESGSHGTEGLTYRSLGNPRWNGVLNQKNV